jgi:hypothetical protein
MQCGICGPPLRVAAPPALAGPRGCRVRSPRRARTASVAPGIAGLVALSASAGSEPTWVAARRVAQPPGDSLGGTPPPARQHWR